MKAGHSGTSVVSSPVWTGTGSTKPAPEASSVGTGVAPMLTHQQCSSRNTPSTHAITRVSKLDSNTQVVTLLSTKKGAVFTLSRAHLPPTSSTVGSSPLSATTSLASGHVLKTSSSRGTVIAGVSGPIVLVFTVIALVAFYIVRRRRAGRANHDSVGGTVESQNSSRCNSPSAYNEDTTVTWRIEGEWYTVPTPQGYRPTQLSVSPPEY
ncbi:hypothetical protein BDZ94DRAFT_1310452 [Collybia nuda]|uniref:Uncharacterized protein n=1 Tax=Collybia nuda TaxID=64659 RepID=A0A9P5Y5B2_9AGAR|nr:hypothetical protein BDZ94DRAFT_1310452 [Collybia nuda]